MAGVVKHWSNTVKTLVKHGQNTGQTRSNHWSNTVKTIVEHGQKTGQPRSKDWSNTVKTLVEPARDIESGAGLWPAVAPDFGL
jgi:hypothetical protein